MTGREIIQALHDGRYVYASAILAASTTAQKERTATNRGMGHPCTGNVECP